MIDLIFLVVVENVVFSQDFILIRSLSGNVYKRLKLIKMVQRHSDTLMCISHKIIEKSGHNFRSNTRAEDLVFSQFKLLIPHSNSRQK